MTKEDWKVLRLIDGRNTIRQMADTLGADIFETGRTLYGLMTVGVVSLEPPRSRDSFYNAVPELLEEPKCSDPFVLSTIQWRVLSFIDGRRDLGALMILSNVSPKKMAEALKEVVEKGFVHVNKPRSKENGHLKTGSQSPEARLEPAAGNAVGPRIRAVGFE